MVKPRFFQNYLTEAGRRVSPLEDGFLLRKDHPESMVFPRYVSAWCMSKQKRCFDLVFGTAALILFSPLMVLIAWLIRMTSEGPALFRQERVGLHQQTFVILKFRTMKDCGGKPDRGPTVTRHGDRRMTRFGVLLRRLKLDELPQLINVVRGEMSFVGPRPKIPQHENLCMLCRPGITGAATIQFSHEDRLLTNVPEELVEHYVLTVLNPKKCLLDANYIEVARFGTDMKILLHTVFKLSNRSRNTLSPKPAHFLSATSSMERTSPTAIHCDEVVEFSKQDVHQSA